MTIEISKKNLGFGAGFRKRHSERVLREATQLNWFEVISENYFGMGSGLLGPATRTLLKLRENYPVALHGVSLSLGSSDPLNPPYLKKLKALSDFAQPEMISDHLCWTGVNGKNLHDLLPLPYTRETLEHVAERIRHVQDFLGRQILIENVSSYLTYSHSELSEWDFLAELTKQADCGILLDLNNIYVSGQNHGFDPKDFLAALPVDRVGQIHLAGHANEGGYLIDTHDQIVSDSVWKLYAHATAKWPDVPVMVEWDDHIPDFEILEAEVLKAKKIAEEAPRGQTQSF